MRSHWLRIVEAIGSEPVVESNSDQIEASHDFGEGCWRISVDMNRDFVASNSGAEGSLQALISAHCFVRPLTDDWNQFYSRSLVSLVVPVRIELVEGARGVVSNSS